MNSKYYDTRISDTVRYAGPGGKLYRISVREQVPYITHERRTRILFANPIGGAFINVKGSRVYFR